MSDKRKKLTSSGVLGTPEGGVSGVVVPDSGMSSSHDGLTLKRGDAGADEGAKAPVFITPGKVSGRSRKETQRRILKPGSKCSKAEGRSGSTSRDPSAGSSNSREAGGDELCMGGERYKSPDPAMEVQVESSELTTRSRASTREGDEERDRSRSSGVGEKRGWTAEESEGESTERAVSVDTNSPAEGSTSQGGPAIKRDRRVKKTHDPGHAGMSTSDKWKEWERVRREKWERERLAELERLAEMERDMSDSAPRATSARAEKAKKQALVLFQELRNAPTEKLTTRVLGDVEAIKKVASTSRNIKGTLVGLLWRTAESLSAVNMALAIRVREAENQEGGAGEELSRLREELWRLKVEKSHLGARVEQMEKEREERGGGDTPRGEASIRPVVGPGKGAKKARAPKVYYGGGSSSENAEEMRAPSPTPSETGRRARAEVDRERELGTLPVVLRPPLRGRTQEIGEDGASALGGAFRIAPRVEGAGGPTITEEAVARIVLETLARTGLLPQRVQQGAAKPTGGKPATRTSEGEKPPRVLAKTPGNTTQGKEGNGKMKVKRKRKKKKKKKGGAAEEGGTAGEVSLQGGTRRAPSQDTAPPRKTGPPSPPPLESKWTLVVRGGGKEKRKRAGNESAAQWGSAAESAAQQRMGRMNLPPRGPRGAAVTLTCPEGSYAEAMKTARRAINLGDLGISGVRTRRAVTGALVLGIAGQEGAAKAEALRVEMVKVFAGRDDIRVSRPVKKSEIRVRDLDDSVTAEDVSRAVAGSGGCGPGDVTVGPIKRGPNGMGAVWVRCPQATARRVVVAGRLTVGWTLARVEALEVRPLQCFKCLEWGHVRAKCTNAADRSGVCYRCGAAGHKAGGCSARAECPVCRDSGRPSDHRLGGKGCRGVVAAKEGRKGGAANAAAPPRVGPSEPARTRVSSGALKERSPRGREEEGAWGGEKGRSLPPDAPMEVQEEEVSNIWRLMEEVSREAAGERT